MPNNNSMDSLNNPRFRLKKLSSGFNRIKVRIPFQPRDVSMSEYAQPKELMINYVNGDAYVKSEDGTTDIPIFNDELTLRIINQLLEILIDGATENYNTMKKLEDLIKKVMVWYMDMTTDDPSNRAIKTYDEILKFFKNIEEMPSIKELLNKKVDKIEGKGLSEEDLTNELLEKLNGIEEGANKYIHPEEKFCNFEEPVKGTIPPLEPKEGGEEGEWIFNYNKVPGLENLTPDTKDYVHPQHKVCNANFPIHTVNGRDGMVGITKEELGFGNILNKKIGGIVNDGQVLVNRQCTSLQNLAARITPGSNTGIFSDHNDGANAINGFSTPSRHVEANGNMYISMSGFADLALVFAIVARKIKLQIEYYGPDRVTDATVPSKDTRGYREVN